MVMKKSKTIIQGGAKKTAQSLWHHNFATVRQSQAVFSKMFCV